jgi:AbrB family looped-hinge helix DNA binding protein
MLESKVFANGSTTLPKPVRDALGVKAGDTVRFVISEKGVHIEQAQSLYETADVLMRSGRS